MLPYIFSYFMLGLISVVLMALSDDNQATKSDGGIIIAMVILWPIMLPIGLWCTRGEATVVRMYNALVKAIHNK